MVQLVINDEVVSRSVNTWIATDPVSLYKAIMKLSTNAVILPEQTFYVPSLQHPVFKNLEAKVKQVSPGFVFQSTCRKASREVVR